MTRKILVALLLLVFSGASFGAVAQVVETFEKYDVSITVNPDGSSHVIETLTFHNTISVPIVPGDAQLTLQKLSPRKVGPLSIPSSELERKPVRIRNLVYRDSNGTVLEDVSVTEEEDSTVIRYGVWVPMPPGESETVILEYDTDDLIERGVLFNQFTRPLGSSTLPIESATLLVTLPSGSRISYSNQDYTSAGSTFKWSKAAIPMDTFWTLSFEYTSLPFPQLSVHGYVVFWSILLMVVLLWVFIGIYRTLRKKR